MTRPALPHLIHALPFAVGLAISTAQAGQPLVTDDAALVTAKTCQVEAWVRPTRDDRRFAIQPACNPTGDAQDRFAIAGIRHRSPAWFP